MATKLFNKNSTIIDSSNINNLLTFISDDKYFQEFTKQSKFLEKNNLSMLKSLLNKHILNRRRNLKTYRIDCYCISIYNRMELHDEVLKLAEELLLVKFDSVVVLALFKSCKKIKNYEIAERVIEKYSLLKRGDFNIQYGLVHYFEFCGKMDRVYETLSRMEKNGLDSNPIQQTVYNFYLQFGFIDDAKRVGKLIYNIKHQKLHKKFITEVQETAEELGSKIGQLYSELDHQKQLAAISDLTLGISHELGQPITNIRYTIQFYAKLFKEQVSKKEVTDVFDSILEETERMGNLVKRLAPLTSRKNVIETFDVVQRIQNRLDAEKLKLQELHIQTHVSPKTPIYIEGDPVHFEQIINNLLLNAIDAIRHSNVAQKNLITILLSKTTNNIIIKFFDTGVGIEKDHQKKIFDPFFTTKPPGEGEGLGLFIIWNLMKGMRGTVSLDGRYTEGSKFLLTIPKNTI